MSRSFLTTSALTILLLITAVGAVDAGLEGAWDHLMLFTVAGVVTLVLAAGFALGHPRVPLRGDLVRWATRRAQLTGEPVEQITDRAVAGYRALLETSPLTPGSGHPESRHDGR